MNRQNSVGKVESPYLLSEENYHLAGPDGQIIPVQKSHQTLRFILPELSSGEEITFELLPSEPEQESKTGVRFAEDAVEISGGNDSQVLQYRNGPGGLALQDVDDIFYRGGYLHPLFTPNGHIITEQYTQGRPHQNGIWTGWYKTDWNGMSPDFWSPAERTGKVEVFSIDKISSGPVHTELQTRHHFIEQITDELIPILSDKWKVRVYNIDSVENRQVHIFDLEVRQENITEHELILKEHVYGGVGFRGSDQWLGEENMQLLTSEGENRKEAHMSRARWVLLSGEIGGELTSIAILAHPDNLRFPEPVFINQREPFFTFAPLQLGDLTLKPGDEFRARYRYIMLDDDMPSPEYIERLWQDYAHPVGVSVYKQ